MQTKHSTGNSIQYDHVVAAWREQLVQALNDPAFKQRLVNHERELLPRFAAQYTKLQTLPRRARRAMQRQWKRSLAGVALLLALGQTPALAATINIGGGGGQTSAPIKVCSLVDAITAANTDTSTGGCPAGSGADTIVLPKGSTQTLTAINNSEADQYDRFFSGPNGLPLVTSAITIQGNGATIRRASSAPEFRIFAVDFDGRLSLQRTRVSGGKTPDGGGGIASAGRVILSSSTISGNSASGGGGVLNLGTLTVTRSTISNNSSAAGGGGGGGVRSDGEAGGGNLTIINSAISGNSAKGSSGGGVCIDYATLTVTGNTISGNRATGGRGGGVESFQSDLTLTNSTISGNSANGIGGGISITLGNNQ
ncbi:MAG: hypothetical protein H0V34_09430 [Gammaproteobacteria bacterium]|nr:hypothetical protein [Gammaproteobacteria bacterium]